MRIRLNEIEDALIILKHIWIYVYIYFLLILTAEL